MCREKFRNASLLELHFDEKHAYNPPRVINLLIN
jgi:hypothetical protein